MAVPASRYRPSSSPFPRCLPSIEYGPDDIVRKVQGKGEIHYRGWTFRVGNAFHGYPVGLRPTPEDGVWDVYFCRQRVGRIDLTEQNRAQTARRSARIAQKRQDFTGVHQKNKKKREPKKEKVLITTTTVS